MALSQFRPKNGDDRMYNPDRDLAWCYPSLIKAAIQGLDDGKIGVWYGDYLKAKGVTPDDLRQVVKTLSDSFQYFVNDESVNSPEDALRKSGFLAVNPAAQLVLMARIGQVMLGAFFSGIRDVTEMDLPPHPQIEGDLAAFVYAATQLGDFLNAAPFLARPGEAQASGGLQEDAAVASA